MIVEAILNLVKSLIIGMIGLMPNLTFFQEIGSIAGLVELIANASYFVPFSTLFICLGIWFIMQQAQLVMSIVNWIIGKVPTIS
jgi:hypothetical protein